MLEAIESKLIYFPSRFPEGNWSPAGLAFEDVALHTEDGVNLHGWFCPCPSSKREISEPALRLVVLYCHGNAGNLSDRALSISALHRHLGVDVFIFDYRGYGKSEGAPSEQGLYCDGRAAYRCLTEDLALEPSRIVLLGRSLGGAVALELGLHVPHLCLVLESAFTSMPDVAKFHYPWLPTHALMTTRYPNLERIANYHGSVFISHGDCDDIIPVEHGVRLFEKANPPKQSFWLKNCGHNDRGGADYFAALRGFLAQAAATLKPQTDQPA